MRFREVTVAKGVFAALLERKTFAQKRFGNKRFREGVLANAQSLWWKAFSRDRRGAKRFREVGVTKSEVSSRRPVY